MKKHLLAATIASAISTTAFGAGDLATPLDSQIYVRIDGFMGRYHHVRTPGSDFSYSYSVRSKAKANPGIEVGLGYNFTSKARLELVGIRPLGTKYNGFANASKIDYANSPLLELAKQLNTVAADQALLTTQATTATSDFTVTNKIKTSIKALMLRGCYDLIEIGGAQLFLTAGIGGSKVSHKLSNTISITDIKLTPNTVTLPSNSYSITRDSKSKTRNNVAWSVGAGLSYEVYDGVRAEVIYRYTNFGKTRRLVDAKGKAIQGTTLDLGTHTASLGLRVAL